MQIKAAMTEISFLAHNSFIILDKSTIWCLDQGF